MDLFDRFKKVKAFVLGVDGVLTNGKIWVAETGQQFRQLDLRDRFALGHASGQGYPVLALCEGSSPGLVETLRNQGIDAHFRDSAGNNMETLTGWLDKKQLDPASVLYIGSDLPDLAYMRLFGFPSCPGDSVEKIKQAASYISPKPGGMGAVRDIVEKTMKLQGTWETDLY